jgi:hypothetical protein
MVMALRRKGQSIAVSHDGRILNRELIAREQFKGSRRTDHDKTEEGVNATTFKEDKKNMLLIHSIHLTQRHL